MVYTQDIGLRTCVHATSRSTERIYNYTQIHAYRCVHHHTIRTGVYDTYGAQQRNTFLKNNGTMRCCYYCSVLSIDIKKVDKQLNVVYGTIRYERCSRNPLSGPLLFIYNSMYLSYIY